MNENKYIPDKELKKLFKQISLDTPSPDFIKNLMVEVEKEVRSKAARQRWIPILQIAAGITGILLIPCIILYFLYPDYFSTLSFSFPRLELSFDSNICLIGLIVLCLLIADTYIRKYIYSKKEH